jgi:hypothetical protein
VAYCCGKNGILGETAVGSNSACISARGGNRVRSNVPVGVAGRLPNRQESPGRFID